MNEIETAVQAFTGEQLGEQFVATGAQTTPTPVELVSQAAPELTVNVQQLGSGSDIAGVLAQWIPFLDSYSDGEILVIRVLILLWLLCVIWVLRDASARSENAWFQLFSALIVVFLTPIIGLPLYLAFRPLVYKWEKWLWREAMEQHLAICPHCQSLNASSHAMCAWCGEPLQVECKQCHCKYQGHFAYCPECWAPNIE